MLAFLRRLSLTLVLAACAAAALVLWLSADPTYEAQEWLGGSRYWAYDAMIREVAAKRGVDPMWIKAIAWRESAFSPEKVGTSGERGLMQVSEAAAQDWAKAEKVETFVATDLFDPRTNIEVGAWYFSKALERWKAKDKPAAFALAEYNAGRKRVDRWVGLSNMGDQATADDLLGAIDFPTTRRYIESITDRFQFYKDRGRM